jgi:hypothetical protein
MGEYSSKKWKSFLKHHKDNDVIKCNPRGLAVVEAGNPAETFRCKNVSISDSFMQCDGTDILRSTTTTSRATLISAPSLAKDPHPGAGSHPMVVSLSLSDRQMVLRLPKSTRMANSSTLDVFLSSRSFPFGERFARSRTI